MNAQENGVSRIFLFVLKEKLQYPQWCKDQDERGDRGDKSIIFSRKAIQNNVDMIFRGDGRTTGNKRIHHFIDVKKIGTDRTITLKSFELELEFANFGASVGSIVDLQFVHSITQPFTLA